MAIDPIKIPQNVYIEDRIVGPLTLKQIMTVGIGGGISYAVWASASKAWGVVGIVPSIIIWTPCVLSIVFAFVKVNDLSMLKLVFLSIERMLKSPQRSWSPRRGITVNIRTFSNVQDTSRHKEAIKAAMAAKNTRQLDAITSALDKAMDSSEDEPTLGDYGNAETEHVYTQSSGKLSAPGATELPGGESRFAAVVPIRGTAVVADATPQPVAAASVDGVTQRAHSSIFRDISAT